MYQTLSVTGAFAKIVTTCLLFAGVVALLAADGLTVDAALDEALAPGGRLLLAVVVALLAADGLTDEAALVEADAPADLLPVDAALREAVAAALVEADAVAAPEPLAVDAALGDAVAAALVEAMAAGEGGVHKLAASGGAPPPALQTRRALRPVAGQE